MEEFLYIEDEAMYNAYDLLTKKITIEELLDRGEQFVCFPFDPSDPTKEDVEKVLHFFEQEEEYEKCSTLLKYLETIQ
tara:strand:+ start:265 stop:498 length:234 start_codon:yes stop_codon:yes gene_type:complete